MLAVGLLGLLVAAFAGAGLYNMIGSRAARDTFVRLGYPAWWCRLTGALEIAAALFLTLPATRSAGLGLGLLIVVAAIVSVLRRREFSHLVPLGLFLALTVAVACFR